MIKKWLSALFLAFLCASFSLAQGVKGQNETKWELLEISGTGACSSASGRNCRYYHYLTSGVSVRAQASLEWMKDSGWELVGVATNDQYYGLYFKRPYNKTRTDDEIKKISTEFEKDIPKPTDNKLLVDLDAFEAQQKVAEFDKKEELKLRTALEGIKDLPVRIVSVSSGSLAANRTRVGAEIVVDATSVLLKDGNKYRSSDADRYFKEIVPQIADRINLSYNRNSRLQSYAQDITRGSFKPVIGNYTFYDGVNLKISVVVNYKNQPIVVAQSTIRGEWAANPQ